MLAVGLSADQASENIEACTTSKGNACIACINNLFSVILSGDLIKILTLQDQFERERVFRRRLIVDTAYHSHHIKVIHSDYIQSAGGSQAKEI